MSNQKKYMPTSLEEYISESTYTSHTPGTVTDIRKIKLSSARWVFPKETYDWIEAEMSKMGLVLDAVEREPNVISIQFVKPAPPKKHQDEKYQNSFAFDVVGYKGKDTVKIRAVWKGSAKESQTFGHRVPVSSTLDPKAVDAAFKECWKVVKKDPNLKK